MSNSNSASDLDDQHSACERERASRITNRFHGRSIGMAGSISSDLGKSRGGRGGGVKTAAGYTAARMQRGQRATAQAASYVRGKSQKPSSFDQRVSDFKYQEDSRLLNYVLSVSTEDEHTYNSLAQGKRENI